MRFARKGLRPLLPLLAVAGVACYHPTKGDPKPGRADDTPLHGSQIAYVVDEPELDRGGASLLNTVASHVAAMTVRHPRGECPVITMRGPATDPVVYVDGARATNTCVLEQMNPGDVHRVEVYPLGVTQRAGYMSQPGGLILVFTRDGT
jgi:hypothetical protein